MLACWRALLANERNEGLPLFEELGPDSASRVRAMQSFSSNLSPSTSPVADNRGAAKPNR